MLGAIIGDIAGSVWEFNPTNDYNFELFTELNEFTDDTVCTVAVADALLHGKDIGNTIHEWCRRYPCPMGGYGFRFRLWVMSDAPKPYKSFGNGSAMRVSPIAWLCDANYQMFKTAEESASCTHNHPEGIKGAQAVAVAIYDCLRQRFKTGVMGQEEIKKGLQRAVRDYNIDIKKEDVQNRFDETCQGTVPVALWIITQSNSFEDAIRRAVSLGADADTLGAIVGSIAEAIWGVPEWMEKAALTYLPDEMKQVLAEFKARVTTEAEIREEIRKDFGKVPFAGSFNEMASYSMRYLFRLFLARHESQLLEKGLAERLSIVHDGYFDSIFYNADMWLNIVPEREGRCWFEIKFTNEWLSASTTIAGGTVEELLAFMKDDQRSAEANVDRVVELYDKFDRAIDEDDWRN